MSWRNFLRGAGSHRLWEINGAADRHLRLRVFQVHPGAAAVQHARDSRGQHRVPEPTRDAEDFIRRSTDISVYAGENFNNGLRSYYFGLAALAWFLHPVLFALATAGVVLVLYQREFRSLTLETLVGIHGKGDWEWPPRRILPPEDGP
ncbi:MAG: DUF599 domain-containing protein [Burkholderiales bacterium]